VFALPWQSVKVEEMINSVAREVKAMPDTVWRLSMLNGDGCQELGQLCNLSTSCDVAVLEDVPHDVHKLAGQIVQKWWKLHGLLEALRQLETARVVTVSGSSN
jgi:hypothetical protein